MKLSTFIIKEEKKFGITRMIIHDGSGAYTGSVTPRNSFQSVEFRILNSEILALRNSYSKTNFDIIKEGKVVGRFLKSGSYRSDIELTLNGRDISFAIFSDFNCRTCKIMSHGIEIGFLSRKRKFLKSTYGLAINSADNLDILLSAVLLHIVYQKNIVLNDEVVFT